MIDRQEATRICTEAVLKYGAAAQEWVAVGEIGELLDALADFKRGRCSLAHVAEEIADVEIMLQQLIVMHQCNDLFQKAMQFKLERLRDNLRKEAAQG